MFTSQNKKKLKAILKSELVNKYIQLHKNLNIPFKITLSNYTTRIVSNAYDLHFMKTEQSNQTFAAFAKVKKDCLKMPLPVIQKNKLKYFTHKLENKNIYADTIYNFDLKSAYANILFKDGYITEQTFLYINKLPKLKRLAAVGMLAGKKNIYEIGPAGEVLSEEKIISPTSPYFFYCVQRMAEIIKGAADILGNGFLFSWVDGIYFNDCPETVKEDAKCPTAGAGISKEGKFRIIFNRQFMESLSDQEMVGVWKHEVCHLLFNHTMSGHKNKQRLNIAMDMAINSYIGKQNLPKGGMFPEDKGFKKFLTSENYYHLLGGDEKPESEEESRYEFDDHSELGDLEAAGASKEVMKAVAEQAAREAAKGLSAGNLPLEMLKSLDIDIYKDGTLSWKTLLRKYAQETLTNTKISTRNKPNRRVGFSADGTTDDRLPNIYIAIDESGSIDDELLQEFAGEVNRLFKEYSGSVKVLHFDTEISKIETYKKSCSRIQRYGGGGTDPSSCFDLFDREKGDLLIMFTDGYFYSPQTCKRGKNVIFLIYNNNSFVPEFGKSIVIK